MCVCVRSHALRPKIQIEHGRAGTRRWGGGGGKKNPFLFLVEARSILRKFEEICGPTTPLPRSPACDSIELTSAAVR